MALPPHTPLENENLTRIEDGLKNLKRFVSSRLSWKGRTSALLLSGLAPDPLLLFLSRQLRKKDPPINLVYPLGH